PPVCVETANPLPRLLSTVDNATRSGPNAQRRRHASTLATPVLGQHYKRLARGRLPQTDVLPEGGMLPLQVDCHRRRPVIQGAHQGRLEIRPEWKNRHDSPILVASPDGVHQFQPANLALLPTSPRLWKQFDSV